MRGRRRLLMPLILLIAFLIGGAAWFFARRDADPFKASAVVDPPFASLTYAVQAFLWWDEAAADLDLHLARLMSFSHVKQTFAWRDLEPSAGEWHWARADHILDDIERTGLRLIARLGQPPAWAQSQATAPPVIAPPRNLAEWARYCRAVAERYRGRIQAYQIWNEPNLAREWGGRKPHAAAYVDLLAACSGAIREVDADAILISAGLAPTGNMDDHAIRDDIYLDRMYRAGFQRHIDVVGVHAPGYAAPEIGPDDDPQRGRWFTFRRVEDLRKIMLHHNDEARQMAILEFGYTTDSENAAYSWFAVTESQQAEYLLRAYDYAINNWRPWIGLMTLIYLPDSTWREADEEYWWAVMDPVTGQPRQAYIDLANMRKVCDDFVIPRRAPDSDVALGKTRAPICPPKG